MPIEAQNKSNLPIEVRQCVTAVQTLPNLSSAIPYNVERNENQICVITYQNVFRGPVVTDCEIESHYYNIYTTLLQTFFKRMLFYHNIGRVCNGLD